MKTVVVDYSIFTSCLYVQYVFIYERKSIYPKYKYIGIIQKK